MTQATDFRLYISRWANILKYSLNGRVHLLCVCGGETLGDLSPLIFSLQFGQAGIEPRIFKFILLYYISHSTAELQRLPGHAYCRK
jgi:hypothetical protein